jgi:hypothetical protein
MKALSPFFVFVLILSALQVNAQSFSRDAGITDIYPICGKQYPVRVMLRNFGTDTLSSTTIRWSVNGTTQTAYQWSGSLSPQDSVLVNIANYTFGTSTYNLVAYTDSVNGNTDLQTSNDTTAKTYASKMGGIYTIGGSSPDYATIQAAVNALNANGICGPVTFMIRQGTYNDQIVLSSVTGASKTNRITFMPDTNNTQPVVWQFNANSSTNYTIRFNSAKYYDIIGLTIKAANTSYARVIDLGGTTEDIEFRDNIIEGQTASSTSANWAVFYDNTGTANNVKNIRIINNQILKGSYGLYLYGGGSSTTTQQDSMIVIGNTIKDFYYMGVVWLYLKNSDCIGNHIESSTSSATTAYGLYGYYSNTSNAIGNNIITYSNSTNYGLYWYRCYGTSTDRSRVYNNMVSSPNATNSSSTRQMYFYYPNYTDIVYNSTSLNNSSTSTTAVSCYLYYGTSTVFRNNSIANFGGGRAVYIIGSHTRTHNNLYTSGSTIGNVTLGSNSISVNPQYWSSTNLHSNSTSLDSAGVSIAGITTDFDGQTRNSTNPDIGADEFTPPQRDGALTQLVPVCAGTAQVTVELSNYGLDTLTNALIRWSVNGTAQTPYTWTGSLATGQSSNVAIGSYTFASQAYNMLVYIDSVNGNTDQQALNDTLSMSMTPSLSGVFTVGGSNPDYATLNAAITDLNNWGVCGPVVLRMRSGTYNEQIEIRSITGASATNTVRITADTGISAPVILTYASTSSAAPQTLRFNGASHVQVDSITVRATGASYARVVDFLGNNEYITIENCRLEGRNISSTSTYYSIVYDNTGTANVIENITIRNNEILNGSYSMYIYGINTSTMQDSITIENNRINGWYYLGIYSRYNSNFVVKGNEIMSKTVPYANGGYGLYSYYDLSCKFIGNNIVHRAAGYSYGMYINRSYGVSNNTTDIYNNMVALPSQVTSANNRALYLYYPNFTNVYHNSFSSNSNSTSTTGVTAYLYQGNSFFFRNNIVANFGSARAMYISGSPGRSYNDIYTSGTALGVSLGSNSISVNPQFFSLTDLHTRSIDLDSTGTALGIVTDIDGDIRNTTKPDIGADEFDPPANNVGISSILSPINNSCGAGNQGVTVVVKNFGTASQTNIPVEVRTVGSFNTVFRDTIAGPIASRMADTVTLYGFNSASGGGVAISAYTLHSVDSIPEDDTTKLSGITLLQAPIITGPTYVQVCAGNDTTLSAVGAANTIRWYSSPDLADSNLLYSGRNYYIPQVNSPDTVYMEGYYYFTGKAGLNTIAGTGNFYTSMNYGLRFNALRNMTIDSITVYPQSTNGSVRFQVRDNQGTILANVIRSYTGHTAGPLRLPVGIYVPIGTNYQILATGSSAGGLWRHTTGATYPYTDQSGIVRITSSSTGSTSQYYFFYDWKVSSEGCHSEMNTIVIDTKSNLNVNLGPDTSYCAGSSINLNLNATTSGAVSYLWHDNSTGTTFNATSDGVYHVRVKSPNGCLAKDSVVVTELSLPNISNSNLPRVCANKHSVKLFGGTPAGGYYSGSFVSNGFFNANAAGAGSHTVYYAYRDTSSNCIDSVAGTLTVDPIPNANLSMPQDTFCNKTFNPLNTGTPSGGYYFGFYVNTVQAEYGPRRLGRDTIGYVYYDQTGCVDTAYDYVYVVNGPNVVMDSVGLVCDNTAPFTINATPAGGVYSGPGMSGSAFNPTSAGLGPQQVSYEVTSTHCTIRRSVTIDVKKSTPSSLGGLARACEDMDSITLVGGLPFGGYYSGQFVKRQGSQFMVDQSGPGNFSVYYNYINQFGCHDSSLSTQEVVGLPVIGLSDTIYFCGDEQSAELDAGNPGASYQWSNGSSSQKINVWNPGTYSVMVTLYGICSSRDTTHVSYNAVCVGLAGYALDDVNVNYYPNPSTGLIHVNIDGIKQASASIRVTSMSGAEVYRSDVELDHAGYQGQIDLSHCESGVYLIHLQTVDGSITHRLNIVR